MALIRLAEHPGINIEDCGADGGAGGIPVLFVHSLAGNATHWHGQLEHLQRERRAIAIDLQFNRIMDEFLLSVQAYGSIFSGATK